MESQQDEERVGSGRWDAVGGIILSLIGIVYWIVIVFSITGIILSVRALSRLQKWDFFKLVACMGFLVGLAGLSAFLIFGFHDYHYAQFARRAACLNNLQNVTAAILTYAGDHGGSFPTHLGPDETGQTNYTDLGILYPLYATSLDLFTCPSAGDRIPKRTTDAYDSKPLQPEEAKHISYAYGLNKNAKNKAWTEAAPATTRILADRYASRPLTKRSNHKTDGRNIAFADGHVKWIPGGASLDSDPGNPDPNAHGTGPDWWSER